MKSQIQATGRISLLQAPSSGDPGLVAPLALAKPQAEQNATCHPQVLTRATSLACSCEEGHPGRACSDVRSLTPAAGEREQGRGSSPALAQHFPSKARQ